MSNSPSTILSDLELCQFCADIYEDPPIGKWDHLWPLHIGLAGHKNIDGVDYIIRRGSKEPLDWLVDFEATPVDLATIGGVHAGFLGSVLWSRNTIQKVLGKRIVLAGHSKASAETAIHAALLTISGQIPERVVCMGTPRPFYARARSILERAKVSIVNYKHASDPVTEVPLSTLFWPYIEPADFTSLKDFSNPTDTGLFKDHHIACYLAGIKNLRALSA